MNRHRYSQAKLGIGTQETFMDFISYIVGHDVRVFSPLPIDEINHRINGSVGQYTSILEQTGFWIPNEGVVGYAGYGRIWLKYNSGAIEFNAKPVLTGTVSTVEGGSLLSLCFRAPGWSRVFFGMWYALLTLMSVIIVRNGLNPELTQYERVQAYFLFAALFIFPTLLVAYYTRNAESVRGMLTDFLHELLDAKVDRS